MDLKNRGLKHHQSSIELEFTALNYLQPKKNRYKYKLDGFDKEWTSRGADKRFANYTNLPPGEYVFRVLGANNDGVWNQTGDTFEFTILPPWWKSPWAILMFSSMFIGILAFVGYNILVANVEKVIFKMESSTMEFLDLLQEPA